MKKYMKILIAIAVMMTLITPSAGYGRVLAEENDTAENPAIPGSVSELTEDESGSSEENGETDPSEQPSSDTERDYHEWQTDIDEYDAEELTTVTFILKGAESVNAAIDSDYDADESGIEYDEVIHDGDTREFTRGSSVRIQGISGSYIRAAYGSTEEEAVNNPDPEISGEGLCP